MDDPYTYFNFRIYSVQALNNSSSSFFYQKIAELTGGYHLHLDQVPKGQLQMGK